MAEQEKFTISLQERMPDGSWTSWGKYAQHRRDARKRGIPFALSFKMWLWIWKRSGQFENRGHRKGQYVMARVGDVGPYAVGNVKIITSEANHSEANLGKPIGPMSDETKLKLSISKRGRKLTDDHKRKIGKGVSRAFAETSCGDRRRANGRA